MPVKKGEINTVEIDWLNTNIRPGEYPFYFWLGAVSFERAYDVVDGLTPPLFIGVDREEDSSLDFNPASPSGYFSVNSKFCVSSQE